MDQGRPGHAWLQRRRARELTDTIVIGAGLAGASAAWYLAEQGHAVTVLEATVPGNAQGSSHGSARIFRYAYPDQLYTDLVVRAARGWEELARRSGRSLLRQTGCLDFGRDRDPAALAAILEHAGVEHELLSAAAAGERWPQLRFDSPVLWHPGAGVLDPEATIAAMLALAEATGSVRVLSGWPVAGLERMPGGEGWRARSETGEVVAGARVIVAVGGWLPEALLTLGLPASLVAAMPPLEVRQEQAFHFPYRDVARDADAPAADVWPCFIHTADDLLTYGLPGGRDAGFRGQKVAQFNGGPVIGSAGHQDGVVREENRALMSAYVTEVVPGLVPEPYAETTCLFTNTPTEDFVIDAADGVVVVSACSGHGAKFAPLLGELAGELALGRSAALPGAFRLPR